MPIKSRNLSPKTLVQKLRDQLERVVQDPQKTLLPVPISKQVEDLLLKHANRLDPIGWKLAFYFRNAAQERRVVILTAAIRETVAGEYLTTKTE